VAGLPVLVSDQVDAATLFWGIPKSHVVLVMRKGTTVERFPAVHQDGTYVRAVARFGLAFLNEAGGQAVDLAAQGDAAAMRVSLADMVRLIDHIAISATS
jgi:hypothetical protein